MGYCIDGERVTPEEGDALFVNARRMRYGYGVRKRDCRFACILFHPSLFTGSAALLKREARPVLGHPEIRWRRLEADSPAGQEAALLLSRIAELKEEAPEAYESVGDFLQMRVASPSANAAHPVSMRPSKAVLIFAQKNCR